MKVVAINDHVIVKEIPKQERITKGGILLPSTAVKEEPNKFGRVISVGEKVKGISPGDIVVFARFGGQTFVVEDETYIVLKEPEVYCILYERDASEGIKQEVNYGM